MIRILMIFGLIILLVPPCRGEIYSYRDKNGHLVLTDAPQNSHRRYGKHHQSRTSNKNRKNHRNTHSIMSKNHEINRLVEKYAVLYDLDERLLYAVIRTESDYDQNAVSRKGAMGLMQLMPETGKQYGVQNFFDPEENIRAGAKHLRALLDRYFGDTKMALAAYNAGITAVDRYNGVPPFKETRNYVSKILAMVNGESSSGKTISAVPKRSTIYRYTDAEGRICLTNIYPENVSGVQVVHQ